MAGRGDFGEVPEICHPRCYMMRNGKWIPMSEPVNPDRAIFNAHFHSGVGLSASFAEALAESEPETRVGLIPCADGGTSLNEWMPGGVLYDNAVFHVGLAKRSSEVAAILWHQGEADSTDETLARSYLDRLRSFFASLRRDAGLEGVPVVVGELGEFVARFSAANGGKCRHYTIVNEALHAFADSDPLVAVASSKGLESKPDLIHFCSAAQREFGLRYYRAYRTLVPLAAS